MGNGVWKSCLRRDFGGVSGRRNQFGWRQTLATARETFAPDRLRNYELGAKLHAFDGRLVAHSALFYDVWKNIQTDQFRPSGIPYTANVGDARVAGLETELAYSWDMGLTLQANALVSQTRIIRANPDYAPELTRGLPERRAFLGAFWRPTSAVCSATWPCGWWGGQLCGAFTGDLRSGLVPGDGRLRPRQIVGGTKRPKTCGGGVHHQPRQRLKRHLRLRKSLQLQPGSAGHPTTPPNHGRDLFDRLLKRIPTARRGRQV
uniref:TonB-dependent receptor n=1 Tax=Phenylobacterium glaciei TaxID=2803784 RepID=A0A974P5Z2_9CAUL|nr:TonB-dependent receptor [Phenylobacterium glaciei]